MSRSPIMSLPDIPDILSSVKKEIKLESETVLKDCRLFVLHFSVCDATFAAWMI